MKNINRKPLQAKKEWTIYINNLKKIRISENTIQKIAIDISNRVLIQLTNSNILEIKWDSKISLFEIFELTANQIESMKSWLFSELETRFPENI